MNSHYSLNLLPSFHVMRGTSSDQLLHGPRGCLHKEGQRPQAHLEVAVLQLLALESPLKVFLLAISFLFYSL